MINTITIWRIMQAGMRNFLRNAWLSTAATAVMTVTLITLLFSYISNTTLTSTIQGIVNKIDVSVYLKDSANQEQTKDLQNRLSSLANVQSVRYVSKQEALDVYRRQNQGNQQLLANISEEENPLPASLAIKAKDPNNLDSIVSLVNEKEIKPLVLKFSYEGDRKATIDRIIKVSNFLKRTGLILSILFVIISILIIFNTIRMAIFTRKSEIEIMKLVGATDWFIRGPFLFEAALYGIIAAVIAVSLGYSILLAGGPKLSGYIDVDTTISYFRNYPLLIIGAELLVGMIIGGISSTLAMSRYLKL